MSNLLDESGALADHLAAPLEVGGPDGDRVLTVYPLFGPAATLDYVAFASTHEQVAITELEAGASVNDLVVQNGSDRNVLLYEGEEVLGAQQNRVLDVSVLIAASAKARIPVSCVEQGRWDGRRHRERFRPSPQAADPRLRRLKHRHARASIAAGMDARADQAEIWAEVASRGAELGSSSSTGAMSDFFEDHRARLGAITGAISLHDGQCGSVAVIGGRIAILDFVGRPDVYAALHPAIVEGYALDALGHERRGGGPGDSAVDTGTVRGFALLTCDAPAGEATAGPGLGATSRFDSGGVEGSALIHAGEIVQLTAYPSDADDEPAGPRPHRVARVNRPSRRHRRRGR